MTHAPAHSGTLRFTGHSWLSFIVWVAAWQSGDTLPMWQWQCGNGQRAMGPRRCATQAQFPFQGKHFHPNQAEQSDGKALEVHLLNKFDKQGAPSAQTELHWDEWNPYSRAIPFKNSYNNTTRPHVKDLSSIILQFQALSIVLNCPNLPRFLVTNNDTFFPSVLKSEKWLPCISIDPNWGQSGCRSSWGDGTRSFNIQSAENTRPAKTK